MRKHSSCCSKHILFIVQDIDLMELIHLHMSQFSVEDCESAGYIKLGVTMVTICLCDAVLTENN